MTKGQEITQAWRKASTEQGHRPGTYQYDADLAARIDAAIAEVAQENAQMAHDQAIDEEREACAREVDAAAECWDYHSDIADNVQCALVNVAAAIRARGKHSLDG